MKRRKSKKFIFMMVVLVLMAALVACGNQSTNSNKGTDKQQGSDKQGNESGNDGSGEEGTGSVEDYYFDYKGDGKCSLKVKYIDDHHAIFTVTVDNIQEDYPTYDSSIEEGNSLVDLYVSLMDGPMSDTAGNSLSISIHASNNKNNEETNERQTFDMMYASTYMGLQGYRGVNLSLPKPFVTQNGKEIQLDVTIPEECEVNFYNFERFQVSFSDNINNENAYLSGVKPEEVVVGDIPKYQKTTVNYAEKIGASLYVKDSKSATIELREPFLRDSYDVNGTNYEPRWTINCYPDFILELSWDGYNTVVNQVGLDGMQWELSLNDWSEKYGFSPINNHTWYETTVDASVVTVTYDEERIVFDINLPNNSKFDFNKLNGELNIGRYYEKGMGYSLNYAFNKIKANTSIALAEKTACGGTGENSAGQGKNQETSAAGTAKVKIDPKRFGLYGEEYQQRRFGVSCDENGENVSISFFNDDYSGVIKMTEMNLYTGELTGTGSLTDSEGRQVDNINVTATVGETELILSCLQNGEELIHSGYSSYTYVNDCDYPKKWLGRYIFFGNIEYGEQPCSLVFSENEQGFLTVKVDSEAYNGMLTAPRVSKHELSDTQYYVSSTWTDAKNNENEILISVQFDDRYHSRNVEIIMIVDPEDGERSWPLKSKLKQLRTHLPEDDFINRDKEGVYGGMQTHPDDGTYFTPSTDDFIIKANIGGETVSYKPAGSSDFVSHVIDTYYLYSYDGNGKRVSSNTKYVFPDAASAKGYYENETGNQYFTMDYYEYYTLKNNCIYFAYKKEEDELQKHTIRNEKKLEIPEHYLADIHFYEEQNPYYESRKEQVWMSKPMTRMECEQIYNDYDFCKELCQIKYQSGDNRVSFSQDETVFEFSVTLGQGRFGDIEKAVRTDSGWYGVGNFHTSSGDWIWMWAEVLVDEDDMSQVTVNWKTYQYSDTMLTAENYTEFTEIEGGSFTAPLVTE